MHFNQAGKKVARRNARATKAAAIAPRPTDLLRPTVRAPLLSTTVRSVLAEVSLVRSSRLLVSFTVLLLVLALLSTPPTKQVR